MDALAQLDLEEKLILEEHQRQELAFRCEGLQTENRVQYAQKRIGEMAELYRTQIDSLLKRL